MGDYDEDEYRNYLKVKRVIRRSENPDPITVVLIILASVMVIYFMFVTCVKKTLTGKWEGNKDEVHTIVQNKWNDTLLIDSKYLGVAKGHVAIVHMPEPIGTKMGVITEGKIHWTNGETWYCDYGY